MKHLFLMIPIFFSTAVLAQNGTLQGKISGISEALAYCTIKIIKPARLVTANSKGEYKIERIAIGEYKLSFSCIGYKTQYRDILIHSGIITTLNVVLRNEDSKLNEVVVTGVSRATLARENAIPVVSVSQQKIDRTIESNIIDVLVKNVPGLNAVKTGPNIAKPFIRGLGYNRVLTLYDGVRQEGQQWGDEHGIEVDPYSIERAEVVKGPSSLIYGSDALAGVVGLIPATAAEHDGVFHGKYFSEYQSNNGLIGNGLRLGYSNAHWSYTLRGSYRIAKNYSNPVDGRVYNSGFRETNASATVKYTNDKGSSAINATLYDNLQGIPDGSRDSITRRFTKQILEGDMDNVKNRQIVTNDDLNSYRLSPLHQHIQHYRLYTKHKYQLAQGDLEGIVGFQQSARREYNHPTAPHQAGLYVKLNTINYGVNYNLLVINNTEFSFGVNGMYQTNRSENGTDFPIPDYNLFDAGAYGFAKYKYNSLTVSAGLRYDQRNLSGPDFYTGTNTITGFDKHLTKNIQGSYLQFPSFKKTYKGLSVSFGTTYMLNGNVSFKANIARGYRAPNITEFASNGLDPGAHITYLGNRNFNPEFSLQEDLGADYTSGSFTASVSIFNNNIKDYIYLSQLTDASGNALTDAQGNKTYQYQQGRAQLYGIEGFLNIHPAAWNGFSIDNSVSLTYGFNRNKIYIDTGINGQYLPLIPPVRLLSSLNKEIKLSSAIVKSINIKASADINAAQNRFLALNNTETATSGYTLFDIGTGASIRYSKKSFLQLQFQVNNFFDLAYQSNLNRLKYFEYYASSPNSKLGIFNPGRNYCVKLIVPF